MTKEYRVASIQDGQIIMVDPETYTYLEAITVVNSLRELSVPLQDYEWIAIAEDDLEVTYKLKGHKR